MVFLVGIEAGSLGWFALLSAAASITRRHLGSRVARWIDAASGGGLVGFDGMPGWRSLHNQLVSGARAEAGRALPKDYETQRG